MWAEIARLLQRLPWWRKLLPRWKRASSLPTFKRGGEQEGEQPDYLKDGDGSPSQIFEPDNVIDMPEPEPATEPLKPKRTMPWAGGTRGKYDTETRRTRETIDEMASLILDRFDGLSIRGTSKHSARVSLMLIDSLLGNDFYLSDEELRNTMQGGGKYSPGSFDATKDQIELADMAWPLNIGIVSCHDDDYDADDDEYYGDDLVLLVQATATTAEQVRGRSRMTAAKMVELRIGSFGANGAWDVTEMLVGLIGQRWVRLDGGMEHRWDNINVGPMSWRVDGRKDWKEWIHMQMSKLVTQSLESRYQWHVAFGGHKHGLRIVLPTNPNGALKLFKDRELTAGKSRREALRHWVEHFIRDDEEHGSIYVRDHLRGNTEFVWNEMETELMVSAYDLEKNDAFRNEAQYWRANRKHNRVRVRLKRGKNNGDK